MAIHGCPRASQMRLAAQISVRDYLCPADGCLLTDSEFAARFRDLLEHQREFGLREAHLLTLGRHFRLPSAGKVIVGRNEAENKALATLRIDNEPLLEPVNLTGPSALCAGRLSEDSVEVASQLVATYTKGGMEVDVSVATADAATDARSMCRDRPLEKRLAAPWRISSASHRRGKKKMEVLT